MRYVNYKGKLLFTIKYFFYLEQITNHCKSKVKNIIYYYVSSKQEFTRIQRRCPFLTFLFVDGDTVIHWMGKMKLYVLAIVE